MHSTKRLYYIETYLNKLEDKVLEAGQDEEAARLFFATLWKQLSLFFLCLFLGVLLVPFTHKLHEIIWHKKISYLLVCKWIAGILFVVFLICFASYWYLGGF